jgi:hypothetical protein
MYLGRISGYAETAKATTGECFQNKTTKSEISFVNISTFLIFINVEIKEKKI